MQRLERVLAVASGRPGRCPHAPGVGSRRRVLSAAGQGLAPAGSFLWRTMTSCAWAGGGRSPAPHTASCTPHWPPRAASRRPTWGLCLTRALGHPGLPRAAAPRSPGPDGHAAGRLARALDGLAPPGGAPPMGCIRALARGVPWRRGWLQQEQLPVFSLARPAAASGGAQAGRAERQGHGRGTGRGPGRAPPSPSVLSGP